MRPYRIRAAQFLTAAALTACSGTATPSANAPTMPQETAATTSPATASASQTSEPTPDERPLQDLLPVDFRGVEAHTFPVGQEMLARLAAAIGIRRRALEAAYASDHGPAFVQMFALRVAGRQPQELLDALPAAAFPNALPDAASITEQRLAGRRVTVISEPSAAATIGAFYAAIDGGTLIIAQALAEPVAEAAFEELFSNGQVD
jgi:hypothetical protein